MYFFFKTIWFLSPFGVTGGLTTLGVLALGVGFAGLAGLAGEVGGGLDPEFLFPAV